MSQPDSRPLSDPHAELASEQMFELNGRTPYPFQLDVMARLLRMGKDGYPCHPLILAQATGSGKSSVYQVVGLLRANVTIVIESTLSLSSDQLSKIEQLSGRDDQNVHCFQLDSARSNGDIKIVHGAINRLIGNTPPPRIHLCLQRTRRPVPFIHPSFCSRLLRLLFETLGTNL